MDRTSEYSEESRSQVSDTSTDSEIIERLNDILANQFTVFTKTLNYHWNIVGPRFIAIHEFLDDQYHDQLKMMDSLAERIRYLNAHPVGTLQEVEKDASVPEEPGFYPDTQEMLADLCEGHKEISDQMNDLMCKFEEQLDFATQDLLVKLQGKHQKMLWMLRAHLETPKSEVRTEDYRLN